MPASYLSEELKYEQVDELVEKITDALTKLEDKTGKYTYKIADGRTIDTNSWNFWEWAQAIGLNGLFNYYMLSSSSDPKSAQAARTLDIIKTWYTARAKEGGTTKNINSMAVLYTLACLVELDETRPIFDEAERKLYNGWVDEWAEWVMNELPRTEQGLFQHITFRLVNKNQVWDDTLMMTVIPLAKIGILRNRPKYVEEAKFQFLMHSQYLMNIWSGLWTHGYEFDGKGGGHSFGGNLWGRGNCWITLAIPMFLDLVKMSPEDPVYRCIHSTLVRQVDALLPLQDQETGLWRTILNDETSYVETSCTAGFSAGMIMACRLGLLDREKYLPSAIKGLKACIAQVQPDGKVGQVSKGTPVSFDPEFYKNIPILAVPFGQSLVIVALAEWLRLEQASK